MSHNPAPYTPEVTDESFAAILQSVNKQDLRRYASRVAMGQRVFRLRGSIPAGLGYSFLQNDPPTAGICLRERADTGAAWLSHESLQRRFSHIFVYPRNMWH
jgi:hypothetical protein